jgi:hypothetical protein
MEEAAEQVASVYNAALAIQGFSARLHDHVDLER